jgi:uncharacterized membrane protein (DUF441 family)
VIKSGVPGATVTVGAFIAGVPVGRLHATATLVLLLRRSKDAVRGDERKRDQEQSKS